MSSDLKPRLCCMVKGDGGYGFHLHGEKGKSGQYIRKVEAASPAEASGLRAGDRVVEVNGENVEKETHHQVVQRIKAVEQETRLLVVDRETDEYMRSLRLTCTEEMAATHVTSSPSASSSPPSPSPSSSAPASSSAPSSPPPAKPGKRENGSVSKLPLGLTGEVPKPTRRSPSRAAKKEALAQAQAKVKAHTAQPPVHPSELFPRLCHLSRAESGYGFNLHSERSRPGQYIRSLDQGSPADLAGLRPQDRLVEVNGVNIEGMRHAEVVAFIKSGGDETRLLVVDPHTDDHFKRMGLVPNASHVKDYTGPPITNGSSPQINGSSSSQSIKSTHSDLSSQGNSTQLCEDEVGHLLDPFAEIGLRLSPTAAEAKEKAHAKRARKRAPQMDWTKKHELFSNF